LKDKEEQWYAKIERVAEGLTALQKTSESRLRDCMKDA
jgi:hypothetical protein